MKKLLFFIPLIAFAQVTQNASYYQLLDAQGNVLEIFVATPEVAATYPACVQQVYPTAIKCVSAGNAGMGWHYDSTTNTFTAPLPEVTTNVAQAPALFTLQDPTPVTFTTNNASVTTNNIAITTNNGL